MLFPRPGRILRLPDEWPSLETSKFSLHFSGSFISAAVSCYRRYLHWHKPFEIISFCHSSVFLFADWSKPYHVPVHKTSCSPSCSLHALARGQPVHNETIIDRSIKEWVQLACASTVKFKSNDTHAYAFARTRSFDAVFA